MLTSAGQQRVMHVQGVGTASHFPPAHKQSSRDVTHVFSLYFPFLKGTPITEGLPIVLYVWISASPLLIIAAHINNSKHWLHRSTWMIKNCQFKAQFRRFAFWYRQNVVIHRMGDGRARLASMKQWETYLAPHFCDWSRKQNSYPNRFSPQAHALCIHFPKLPNPQGNWLLATNLSLPGFHIDCRPEQQRQQIRLTFREGEHEGTLPLQTHWKEMGCGP